MKKLRSLLAEMPAPVLVLLIMMINLPAWAFFFLPRPWILWTMGASGAALTTTAVYYVLPTALVATLLLRSFGFLVLLALEGLGVILHALAGGGAATELTVTRLVLLLVACVTLPVFASRDFLHPFFARGMRRWRRAPRFYANAKASLAVGDGIAVVGVLDDLSLGGVGVTVDAQASDQASRTWRRGDVVRVTIGRGKRSVEIGGKIMWVRDEAHVRRLGIATHDPEAAVAALDLFRDVTGPAPHRTALARLRVSSSARRAAVALWAVSLGGTLITPACGELEATMKPRVAKRDMRSQGSPAIPQPDGAVLDPEATPPGGASTSDAVWNPEQSAEMQALQAKLDELSRRLGEHDSMMEDHAKRLEQLGLALTEEAAVRAAADVALSDKAKLLAERLDGLGKSLATAEAAVMRAAMVGDEAKAASEALGKSLHELAEEASLRDDVLAKDLRHAAAADSEALVTRIAALDAKLGDHAARIAALQADLEAAATAGVPEQVTKIASELATLRGTIAALDADSKARFAAMDAKSLALAEAVKTQDAALRAKLEGELAGLRREIDQDFEREGASLLLKLAEAERRVRAANAADVSALAVALRSEIKDAAERARADLLQYQQDAVRTFATREYVDGGLKALTLQIATTADFLSTKFDGKLSALAAGWDERFKTLTLSNATLATDLATMRAGIAALSTTTNASLDALERHIESVRADSTAATAALGRDITAVNSEVLAQRAAAAVLRGRMDDAFKKIDALEGVDAALLEEIGTTRSAFFEAVEKEQAQREALGERVDVIATELAAAAQRATQALSLSQATAAKLASLDGKVAKLGAALGVTQEDLARLKETVSDLERSLTAQIDEVEATARGLVAGLGAEVEQSVGDLVRRVGNLRLREETLIATMGRLLAPVLGEADTDPALTALTPLGRKLSERLGKLMAATSSYEAAFVDAVDPIVRQNGVDVDALSGGFASVQTACGVAYAPIGKTPAVASFEWFFHLARRGVQQAIAKPPTLHGLTQAALAKVVPPLAQAVSGPCVLAIDLWATTALDGLLNGVLRSSDEVKIAGAELRTAFAELDAAAVEFDREGSRRLAVRLSEEKLKVFLYTSAGGGEAGFYPTVVDLAFEHTAIHGAAQADEADVRRLISVARRFAANEAALAAHDTRLKSLETAFSALSLGSLPERFQKLAAAQVTTLSIVMAMALREGYGDLAKIARGTIRDVAGLAGINEGTLPACRAAWHEYLHAYDAKTTERCESARTLPDEPTVPPISGRCAIHVSDFDGSDLKSLKARTWGNTTPVFAGWDAWWQANVGNGLKIVQYDPKKPAEWAKLKELAARKPGTPKPADDESTLVLKVIGANAKAWRINVTSKRERGFWPYSIDLDAEDVRVGVAGVDGGLLYSIPLPGVIGPLGGDCRWDRQVEIIALGANGDAGIDRCVHTVHTFSPIVLDFSGSPALTTVNPLRSGARFDLDADGTRDATGWVGGAVGLLGMDRDGDGAIGDGRELFGEATELAPGRRAPDGYAALSVLDLDHDGMITERDPAFRKLRVWFDRDGDGISRVNELRTLASLGVTKVGTATERVALDQRVLRDGDLPEGNVVELRSRFFGPARCGDGGCFSYDVHFGNSSTKRVAERPDRR